MGGQVLDFGISRDENPQTKLYPSHGDWFLQIFTYDIGENFGDTAALLKRKSLPIQ
jgi:hypothetical protein